MIYIGVDLGYREPTTVVVVRPLNVNNRFTFSSIREGTDFSEVVEKVAEMMQTLGVPLENVHAPRFPAFEHELANRFKKDVK